MDNGRETRARVTFGDRAMRRSHQTLRPHMFGDRKRSELTPTDVFDISHVAHKNAKEARSPNLTPTHVWRTGRLKGASSALQMLIFRWFYCALRIRCANAKTITWVTFGGLRRVQISMDGDGHRAVEHPPTHNRIYNYFYLILCIFFCIPNLVIFYFYDKSQY